MSDEKDRTCETCTHALYICEGGFVCEECGYCIIAEEFEFAEMVCNGERWEQ